MTRPVIVLLFALAGCATPMSETPDTTDGQGAKPNANQTHCEEPRGQVCTLDYTPVCGTDNQGKFKTYSNACTACSNAVVVMHYEGEC